MAGKVLSDDELKKKLTSEQFEVMRRGATEAPFTGKLLHTKDKGVYTCAACGAVLFKSGTKFDSGSGWPSFYDVANSDAVKLSDDSSHGMKRTEVTCATCGSHLGHVFNDVPEQPTGLRYCINSLSLDFKENK